jgi:hypothetical protein
MKNVLLFLVLLGGTSAAAQTADSLYIVTYTVGSLWDQDKSPQEQHFFSEHSAHLAKLRKDNVIKMGARYADKGMIIIQVASMKVAEEKIKEQDPAIRNALFTVTIQPLYVFYEGMVERPK